VTAALYIVAYALLSTGGVLFLRSALRDVDGISLATVRTLLAEPTFLLGFLLYALSFATWVLALQRYQVVVIFPAFVGVSYACVVVGGHFFLGESLTLSRVAGILIIFAGIALVFR
jgi:small multidrug resistance pump